MKRLYNRDEFHTDAGIEMIIRVKDALRPLFSEDVSAVELSYIISEATNDLAHMTALHRAQKRPTKGPVNCD